jgi:pseudouridine kinase
MAIYERLTPDWFAAVLPVLNAAALIVLDANLPAESIDFLAERCTAPLMADPVSAAKAPRLRGALGRLHTLKPNRLEAEALSGVAITDDVSVCRAADELLKTGLRRVFLTLGPDGVLAAEGAQRLRLPNPPQHMVNASGCGDAFTAALAWAAVQGADLGAAARCGLAAAAVAMESAETVNPALSPDRIRSRMELN